jgi:hypothetical protein
LLRFGRIAVLVGFFLHVAGGFLDLAIDAHRDILSSKVTYAKKTGRRVAGSIIGDERPLCGGE